MEGSSWPYVGSDNLKPKQELTLFLQSVYVLLKHIVVNSFSNLSSFPSSCTPRPHVRSRRMYIHPFLLCSHIQLDLDVGVLSAFDHEPITIIVRAKTVSATHTDHVLDWLPNHILVIHVLLLFSLLNPFVLPFGAIYFFIQSGSC